MPLLTRISFVSGSKPYIQSATRLQLNPLHRSQPSYIQYPKAHSRLLTSSPIYENHSFAQYHSSSSELPRISSKKDFLRQRFLNDSASVHIPNWRNATRAQSSQYYPPPVHQYRNSLGGWTVVIAVGLASGLTFIYNHYLKSKTEGTIDVGGGSVVQQDSSEIDWTKMTGESLPGRPGNLTPEEEEKLRELWIATLQVFGVLNAQHAKEVNGNGSIAALDRKGTTELAAGEKGKKRRLGLFSRKHKDSDAESTTSTESGTAMPAKAAADSDKYGQTKQFHDTIAQQSPETLRATFWSMLKHDHPDALLLRFLRARKWDVEKALIMMISTMNWRHTDMHVDDDIMKNGELAAFQATKGADVAAKSLGEDFLSQIRMGKSFLHGTDATGRPMCFVRVRLHKQGEQSEASLERYTVFVIESARMVLSPPIDTAVSLKIKDSKSPY
jgi:hypothetical protein